MGMQALGLHSSDNTVLHEVEKYFVDIPPIEQKTSPQKVVLCVHNTEEMLDMAVV
jgi:hypothetical protein